MCILPKKQINIFVSWGVVVNSSKQVSVQYIWQLLKKTDFKMDSIRKDTETKTVDILMPRHESMVVPHLQYCMQFWSPYL